MFLKQKTDTENLNLLIAKFFHAINIAFTAMDYHILRNWYQLYVLPPKHKALARELLDKVSIEVINKKKKKKSRVASNFY